MATYYVSNTATNGYAVGNDSNTTTQAQNKATPWLTLASAHTQASAGDTIITNSNTFDQGASQLSITKAITIGPEVALGASIIGSHASGPLVITPANGATTTIGAFIVSGGTTGGQAASINNSANVGTVEFNGTEFQGGTTRMLLDSYRIGTTKLTSVRFTGTGPANSGACGYGNSTSTGDTAAKTVTVTNPYFNITCAQSGLFQGLSINRTGTAPNTMTVTVTGGSGSITSPASLGTSARVIGVDVLNTAATVDGFNVTITATGATAADSSLVRIGSIVSAAVCDKSVVKNCVATLNILAGYGILIGVTGASSAYCSSCQVYNNTLTIPSYNGVNTAHCISWQNVTNAPAGGQCYGNIVYGGAVGILSSLSKDVVFSGNLCIGNAYCPLFAKGNTTAYFLGNTVVIRNDVAGVRFGNYGGMGAAIQSATNNAATLFANNHIYNYSDATMPWVVVDASQTATFKGNNYYAVGSVPASPWSYQGVTQSSLSGWQGAQEATATSTNPGFVIAPNSTYTSYDLRPATGSAMVGVPTYTATAPIVGVDFRGRTRNFPPYVGAYEPSSGDPLVTARTARS